MAYANPLRALRDRGQEDLRSRRMGKLSQEVVLHSPGRGKAHAIGKLDLLDGFPIRAILTPLIVRPRDLDLVEKVDLQGGTSAPILRPVRQSYAPEAVSSKPYTQPLRLFGPQRFSSCAAALHQRGVT